MYNQIIKNINRNLKFLYIKLQMENPEYVKHYPETNETFVLFPNSHAFNMHNLEQGFISAFSFEDKDEDFKKILLYRTSAKGQQRGSIQLYINDENTAERFYQFTIDMLLGLYTELISELLSNIEEKELGNIDMQTKEEQPDETGIYITVKNKFFS